MDKRVYGLALLIAAIPAQSAPVAPAPPPHGVLGAYVRGPSQLVAGTPAALRIATHWATSEQVSGPFSGVAVEVTLEGAGRRMTVHRGRTDGAGVADARFVVPEWPEGNYTLTVDARSAQKHDVRSHEVSLVSGGKLLFESDKPLYQPTQIIHLRAIAVRPGDGRPVGAHPVTFSVLDPRGNQVFKESRPLSAFGVAAADFALADEITNGTYHARVELGDNGPSSELQLSVERYSLPKFKVAIETDKPFYAPGDRVKLSIDSRYFFGKPVAGAKVKVKVSLEGGPIRVELSALHAVLDKDGKVRLEAEVPGLSGDEANLRISAEVTDTAEHCEQGAREVTVSREPVRLEVTTEGARVVPGADNRVWVAATRPDGAPIAGEDVELTLNGGKRLTAKSDAIGVAEFLYKPVAGASSSCGANRAQLEAALRVRGGFSHVQRCVPVAPAGSLLLRTDRSIYPFGASVQAEVLGLGPDGIAYLDVVKEGQTVDTAEVRMLNGHGQVTLPPDERRFGTLSLEAYRIAPDGAQVRDAHVVYVERPAALKVEVHAEGAQGTFRPGESGKIRLHVVDAKTGRGTQAQLGVVMVDQALLALKSVKPGAARVYFTLAQEATRPQLAMKARPGGYTVERLLDEPNLDGLKQEAARILLAGAVAPWSGWEIDPWTLRKSARDEQVQRLGEKLATYTHTHDVGERVGEKHWRWRRELLTQMIGDGALPQKDAHDPWGRRIASSEAVSSAGLGEFEPFALEQVNERLTAIYQALARAGMDRKLPPDPDAAKKKGVVLAMADLEKLAADGKLPKYLLTDPWGQPWRIEARKRAFLVATIRSRFLIASNGPDGVPSKDDLYPLDESYRYGRAIKVADIMVMGATANEAFGVGGLGLIGRGYGGGGSASGYGMGMGRIGTVGHGMGAGMGAGGGEARVRQDFPETMLWRPELLTDANGDASLDVTMADSITTWQLTAEAIAADGRLGQTTAEVRVFQDFFVDLDLPPTVTQHDELAVPVAVYNYLPGPQRVTLELEDSPWFERLGDKSQSIDLSPSQVGVRYFRIRSNGVGRKKLLVRARGTSASDAIEKSVELVPDGAERAVSFQDRLEPGTRSHQFTIPPNAIADASIAGLKIYPSMATHVIEGLDSMLRMPGGCFEQTSSTTYPNALILDYLRTTGKATPEVEKKAKEYLAAGYQRLLSFEVPGGGFSWFGSAPANKILTAYGIEEFFDMARVHTIDRRVIERTQEWLVKQQKADGSWAPDSSFINEGATNHFNNDVTRITAYIAVALKHTGYKGAAVARASDYVRNAMGNEKAHDAYTLALAVELLSGRDHALDAVLERLWASTRTKPTARPRRSRRRRRRRPTAAASRGRSRPPLWRRTRCCSRQTASSGGSIARSGTSSATRTRSATGTRRRRRSCRSRRSCRMAGTRRTRARERSPSPSTARRWRA